MSSIMLGHARFADVKSPGFPETDKNLTSSERFYNARRSQANIVCRQEFGVDFDRNDTARKSLGQREKHINLRGKTLAQEIANAKDTPANLQKNVSSTDYDAVKAGNKINNSSQSKLQDSLLARMWLKQSQDASGQRIKENATRESHCEATGLHMQDVNGEDWRSLSRALGTGQKFSSISNHDLMRIAELRLSSDMQEGNSGSQVLLLQKALFWLGYLPTESNITGYFCTKTKQALCNFQESHGVNQTGIWGALSKQALWHNISGEILHRVADEKSSKKTETSDPVSIVASMRSFQMWNPVKLADSFAAGVPKGEFGLLPGVALLAAGVLFGVIISRFYVKEPIKGNPLNSRVILPKEQEDFILPSNQLEASKLGSSSNETNSPSKAPRMSTNKLSYTKEVEPNIGNHDSYSDHKNKIQDPLPSLGHEHRLQNTLAMSLMPYRIGRKIMNSSGKSLRRSMHSKSSVESGRTSKHDLSSTRSILDLEQNNQSKSHSLDKRIPISYQREDRVLENPSLQTSGFKNIKHPQVPDIQKNGGNDKTAQRADELEIKKRIEDLKKAIEVAEQNGQAAIQALAEERKRSIGLEEKIHSQRESAVALEKEVRVLKESHDVLLESIKRNYS